MAYGRAHLLQFICLLQCSNESAKGFSEMNEDLIKRNLAAVLAEVRKQGEIGKQFPPDMQSFAEMIENLSELIEDAREYGIAYETLVATLELFPFVLKGPTVVKLLEVGLLFGFKTGRDEDTQFNIR